MTGLKYGSLRRRILQDKQLDGLKRRPKMASYGLTATDSHLQGSIALTE